MSVTVSEHRIWRVRCSDCGWRHECGSSPFAETAAANHRREHLTSRIVGRSLAGRVFDTDAPDVKWFGHVEPASVAAREAGYSFFTWNGKVLLSANWDTGNAVCEASDVPGLTDSKVS